VVTWPGRFARGRIVAAAYRQMGVEDAPVVKRLEDYADLAVALANDRGRLQGLRDHLRERADDALFRDTQALAGFEAFLEAAVAAAGRGEHLPKGWKPAI
jgi:predicted O-linked N-acetylglucosamine transferase (SPINDLY family)